MVDALDGKTGQNEFMAGLIQKTDPNWQPISAEAVGNEELSSIKGLAWRQNGEIKMSPDRNFIPDLNELPLPMHHLLPNGCLRGCIKQV